MILLPGNWSKRSGSSVKWYSVTNADERSVTIALRITSWKGKYMLNILAILEIEFEMVQSIGVGNRMLEVVLYCVIYKNERGF